MLEITFSFLIPPLVGVSIPHKYKIFKNSEKLNGMVKQKYDEQYCYLPFFLLLYIKWREWFKACFERNQISRKRLIVKTPFWRHFQEHFLSIEGVFTKIALSSQISRKNQMQKINFALAGFEYRQKCPNFKVNDKMPAVAAKRTPGSCSPCQN